MLPDIRDACVQNAVGLKGHSRVLTIALETKRQHKINLI